MMANPDVFQTIPVEFASIIRWVTVVTGVAAMSLMMGIFWAFRDFVRGYGLAILLGIICYAAGSVYVNAYALSRDNVPLSFGVFLNLTGHLVFIYVGLEPARTKRYRIAQGNRDIDQMKSSRTKD